MRHSKLSLFLFVIPCLLLAVLFAACSSDNPVSPAAGVSAADKGGLDIPPPPPDPDPIPIPGVLDPALIVGLNNDFLAVEWEEVIVPLDLKGDEVVVYPQTWDNRMPITITVSTDDVDLLANPDPLTHTMTLYIPVLNGRVITNNCDIYKISGYPYVEGVRVEMRWPMPTKEDSSTSQMFWIGRKGSYSDPESFQPASFVAPEGDYYEVYMDMGIFNGASLDDVLFEKLVLDPLKPGIDP